MDESFRVAPLILAADKHAEGMEAKKALNVCAWRHEGQLVQLGWRPDISSPTICYRRFLETELVTNNILSVPLILYLLFYLY